MFAYGTARVLYALCLRVLRKNKSKRRKSAWTRVLQQKEADIKMRAAVADLQREA